MRIKTVLQRIDNNQPVSADDVRDALTRVASPAKAAKLDGYLKGLSVNVEKPKPKPKPKRPVLSPKTRAKRDALIEQKIAELAEADGRTGLNYVTASVLYGKQARAQAKAELGIA